MADTFTPEVPKVTNTEALHMHNESVVTAGITADKLEQLAKERAASKDPREFLRKVVDGTAVQSFSADRTANLLSSFGGGNATKTETGEIIIKDGAGEIETQRFNEAQGIIAELAGFQKYAEVLKEAQGTGKTAPEIATEKGYGDFNELRSKALKTLTTELLRDISPELAGLNEGELQTIVDERLAKDPAFRAEVSTLLSQVKIPTTEISKNSEAEQLTTDKGTIEERRNAAATEIKTYIEASLKDSGVDLDTIKIDELVKKYVDLPYNTADILNDLDFDLGGLFPEYPDYNEYVTYKKKIDELTQAKLKLGTKDEDKKGIIDAQIDQLKESIDFDTKKETYEKDGKFKAYINLKTALSTDKANGSYTSPVARRVQEMLALKNGLSTTTEKLSKAQTSGDLATSKSRDERLEQERVAIDQLRQVLPKAIAQTLLDRAEAADKVRASNASKDFDADTKKLMDVVQKTKQTRGLGYSENGMRGQRLNNRDEIIGDARALALNKDKGLRELTLRYAGLLGTNKLNEDGTPTAGDARIQSYDDLNSRQRAMIDKIYTSESNSIKMKVAQDLVASQSFMDKLRDKIPGTDKNGLNDTEWEEFGKFYKDDVTKIVSASQEGRQAIAQLEAAGIKPESKKGMGILMWLALLLAGGATIASLGGLANIIPAIAGTGFAGIKAVAVGAGGGGADAVTAVANGS